VSKARIIVATLLALAVAAPAMAFDVQIQGDFNNRFGYTTQSDVTSLNSLSNEATIYVNSAGFPTATLTDENGDNDDEFFGEAKYRMHFIGTDDEKKVKGVIGLELGAKKYGETDASNKGFRFGGDGRDTIELQYAYTDFELPFDPATRMILGLQPVGLNKWVWSDNAAGVKLASKRGDLAYSLNWFRNEYTYGTQEDTRDVYALDVKWTAKDMPKLNLFALYSHNDAGSLAFDDEEIWLGAAIDGQAGAFFYGATAVYLTGEVDAENGLLPNSTRNDADRSAYFLNAEGVFKAGQARYTLGWMYASGDDDPTDGDIENYDVIDVYVPVGSVVIFDSFADDNTAATSPYIQDKGYNMVYAKADFDLSDKTTVGAGYFWHNTAEDLVVNGLETDKDLGHEIVLAAAHKITKNLTAGLKAGYLIGGDAWDALAANDDSDDVFVTDASLRLKF
jgi:hypothetical protein